uniref:Si:cabz01007807.1 n=1 Tax=Hucho hucho TaxID=62062 RepID=A0A4W5NZN8_9TELE
MHSKWIQTQPTIISPTPSHYFLTLSPLLSLSLPFPPLSFSPSLLQAEWRSAQIDEQLAEGLEDEEEEEEEGVHRSLSVFNKVFTERAEVLWQYVIKLHALADDITSFHKKAKIGNITGGTTAAVGGGAAIVGLALAPFTFGASLIITAVGVGVAAAGGITSASATISDNVNNMQDRKKVEVVLEDYEARMEELVKILRFVCQGLYRLRGHPLLRRGTQHYSGDWEVRRAVQMVSLVDRPVLRATEVTEGAAVALRGLFKGMDKYFTKDSRELKKGFKKEVVFKIRQVAQVLHESLVELNAIREDLGFYRFSVVCKRIFSSYCLCYCSYDISCSHGSNLAILLKQSIYFNV